MEAQFWSFDITFAIIVFTFSIIILAYAWLNVSSELSLSYGGGEENMQAELRNLQSTLLSQGSPPDWNSAVDAGDQTTWINVTAGLLNKGNSTLSTAKIMTLAAMSSLDYQHTKAVLGVGFDYYIIITGDDYRLTIGRDPSLGGATAIDVAKKSVIVDGRPAVMQIYLWTDTTFGIA